MNQIKFSHKYAKFLPSGGFADGSEVMLIQFFVCFRSQLYQEFEVYDTSKLKGGFYELPKGKVLVLIFRGLSGGIFTTIRRHTPQKEGYYRTMVGERFIVKIALKKQEGEKQK